MFITKMALPRRTFLRGIGASLALPLLDAMVPAFTPIVFTAAKPVERLAFVYLANGVAMCLNNDTNYWKPKSVGPLSEDISTILKPLSPYRDQMTVVSQMTHPQAFPLGDGANGDHTRATSVWLSGVHPRHTSGADVRSGITADQVAASVLGKDTVLPSLELCIDLENLIGECENGYSCIYVNGLAWMNPTTPLPNENNPRLVFEKLFGDGSSASVRLSQAKENRSILDSVTDEMKRLSRALGADDRHKVNDYFDSVREVEGRIRKIEKKSGESAEVPMDRPTAIPSRLDEHAQILFDLQWLAFRTDTTRVTTFMLGHENNGRAFPEIGVPDGHHSISHHKDNPETLSKLARVNTYQTQQVAHFLERLKSTPEGDGTLLDHSHIVYGAGLSDPNAHAHRDLPLVVVGGGAARHNGGQHVAAPVDSTMCNLLLTMLDRVGVPLESFGDSTGRLDLKPRAGSA
jgi:Protein of unknown function (DUF1552)